MLTRIRINHGQGCITGTALVNLHHEVFFAYDIAKNRFETSTTLSERHGKRLLEYVKRLERRRYLA